MKKMLLLHQGKAKKSNFNFIDELCEEQAFPYLLPQGKFGYSAPRDITISPAWYFNQQLLNFNQYFALDASFIFFARPVYKQNDLHSSINFGICTKLSQVHLH